MSTNKTANYQLHLWEPGDDFLRKEFNENNVKIDTALKAQAEELNSAVAEARQTAASALAAYKASNDAAVANVRSELAAGDAELSAAVETLAAADRTVVLGRYSIDASSLTLDIDVSGFDLTKYTALELRFSDLTSSESFSLQCYLNNVQSAYCNEDNTGYVSTMASFSPVQVNGGYSLSGEVMIHLDGPALFGTYTTYTCYYYESRYFFCGDSKSWGLHHHFLLPSAFTTINIRASGTAPTGEIYLLGHRF